MNTVTATSANVSNHWMVLHPANMLNTYENLTTRIQEAIASSSINPDINGVDMKALVVVLEQAAKNCRYDFIKCILAMDSQKFPSFRAIADSPLLSKVDWSTVDSGHALYNHVSRILNELSTATHLTEQQLKNLQEMAKKHGDGILRCNLKGFGKVTLLNLQGTVFLLLTHVKHHGDTELGRGASKRVKYAVNLATGERVAVSIVSDNKIEKSLQEINIQSECAASSRHILPVLGFWVDRAVVPTKNRLYLLTPFCDGNSLEHTASSANGISDADLIQWTYDILRGMRDLDQQGICHKDLHWGNYFINRDRALIADLGESKKTTDTKAQAGDRLNFNRGINSAIECVAAKGPITQAVSRLAEIVQGVNANKLTDLTDVGLHRQVLNRAITQFETAFPDMLKY